MNRHGSSVTSRIGRALCAILTLVCLCILGSAFIFSTATLTGRVSDSNAAAIVGAKVDANNIDTNLTFSTVTNDEGLFVIPNLPPGRYRIFVQKDGFQTIVKPNVILHVQDIVSLSFSMQLGSITQSVTIEGGAPLIQKESATVGTVVDRQFVENLPLNGRSFQSLITITPGVVLTKANGSEQGQLSVNGQRANANYFTIDGVSANIASGGVAGFTQSDSGSLPGFNVSGGTNNLVSVDALQEFKVHTSTFAAEFGRTPGAQVQIVTRSGTNEFRGTLFEYFRNDALDANDWFANSRGLKRPPLRQNDFGGVLGGPIRLPKNILGPLGYDGRSRTFFFFSYEGLRLRQPQTEITTVPSINARQSAPAGIQPFLNAFPRPNGRDLADNFSEFNATFSNPSMLNATSIRIDHTLSSKLTLFTRYNHAPSEAIQRGGTRSLNFLTDRLVRTQTLTTGATLAIAPTITNDFRANYSRNRSASVYRLDTFGEAILPPDSVLFPPFASSQNGLFIFALNGGTKSSIAIGNNGDTTQRQINLVDTVSIIVGAHQLKFGVDYRRLSPILDRFQYTQQASFNGVSGALTGQASSVFISGFSGKQFPLLTNLSLFGQDTWRISPRLTLTYGLRWELNPPPSEKNGNDSLAVNGLDDPTTLSFVLPRGTPIYQLTYGNFAPRVGVAYQLSQTKGKETVLRAGVGIFYDTSAGPVLLGFGASFPNSVSKNLTGGAPFPLDPVSATPPPFPSLTPPISTGAASVSIVDPHLKLPYTYQWNVAVERSLGPNQSLSASYVAAVGRRLLRQEALFNPNPNFSAVLAIRNQATSDYHGLQLQFRRRLSRGLQALASYAWSHSLDTASNDSISNADVRNINLAQERGPSDFDVRQSFNGAVTYNIPVPFKNKSVSVLLRNFSVDTIFTARTATPVNVVTGKGAVSGSTGDFSISRPDLAPGASLYINDPTVPGGRRFNRAAFITPAERRQGTLGRNALRGFPMWQVDFALRRQIVLTERASLQFRAEAFNLFNHSNFGDPGANFNGTNVLTNTQFGQSVNMLGASLGSSGRGVSSLYQVGGSRSVQLALRLQF